jgi:hypothetical protein
MSFHLILNFALNYLIFIRSKRVNAFWKRRGEWGCMKRKIVWGKVKHSCYFSAKTSLKFVSTKNTVRVSFCPVFHTAPFTPIAKVFHGKKLKMICHDGGKFELNILFSITRVI